jgi:hypothetical protein
MILITEFLSSIVRSDYSTHCTPVEIGILVSEVPGGCSYGDVGAAVAVSTLPKPLGDDMLLVHLAGQAGGRMISLDKKLPGKRYTTHASRLHACFIYENSQKRVSNTWEPWWPERVQVMCHYSGSLTVGKLKLLCAKLFRIPAHSLVRIDPSRHDYQH